MMISELCCCLLGLALLAYAAEYLLGLTDKAQEPPRLRSNIPLIGHVLGIIRNGPSYHSRLRYDESHFECSLACSGF
jgi:hypothetical protein